MGKVKVSREVAAVLDSFEKSKLCRDTVLRNYAMFLDAAVERKANIYQTFVNDGISLLGLAEILVKGYEVEQTLEEKVKEYFDTWNEPIDGISNSDWTSEQKAIIGKLNRLNIKVPGVNE